MLRAFLEKAHQDEPVYITDVRRAFQAAGTEPFHLHVTLYGGQVRRFPLMLPHWHGEEEKAFVSSYVYAMVYNLLSSLGAAEITVYLNRECGELVALAESLTAVFQVSASKNDRKGYGKCLNVNERILSTLSGGKKSFAFTVKDVTEEPQEETSVLSNEKQPVFDTLPKLAEDRMLLGIDIGGTDIKLAASVNGKLAVCKEFDWNPVDFATAEEFTAPVLLLTKLMRAAAGLYAAGQESAILWNALEKDAGLEEMRLATEKMEWLLGDALKQFDGIGLSFPDVIIDHQIVGGETTKTRGMRENTAVDYEAEFRKLGGICQQLRAYTTEAGTVRCCNDGPMSAFTAAVEQSANGDDLSDGVFAYSLGTELGTGWLLPDGSIPDMPLEVYNFIVDLGSFHQKAYDCLDVRSNRNVNTNLAGSLQKYTGQSGVFRLAVKWLGKQKPALLRKAKHMGLFACQDGRCLVPTEPEDRRKECLEFFMNHAAEGDEVCQKIFREIGAYLAVTWAETDYLLNPSVKSRILFGRLVKLPACFALMCEGAAEREPSLQLLAADSSLAVTTLMKELEAHPRYTVAQFAQAIGAIYFACT